MAAIDNETSGSQILPEPVFPDSVNDHSFKLSPRLKNNCAFLCDGLDSFLESLDKETLKDPGPSAVSSACADVDPGDPNRSGFTPRPIKCRRSSVSSNSSKMSKVTLDDDECPKPLICFKKIIPVSNRWKFTRSIEFVRNHPSDYSVCLSEKRFPAQLSSLYKVDGSSDSYSQPEVGTDQSPKTHRKGQIKRLSLSDHAVDNAEAHVRRNLLPTDDDLRSTFDKIYNLRSIPYIFKCAQEQSCESSLKCSKLTNSFRLYMEVNPKPGTPMHPLVRENLAYFTDESCVVNQLNAFVAVSAVKCKKPQLNRLFIPVSQELKDKIGCFEGIISDDVPPAAKIEDAVEQVVADLLDFVDRQLSFNADIPYDPDQLSSADNSFNEGSSQENMDCSSTIKPDEPLEKTVGIECSRKRKRGFKHREPSRVIRELKRLINVSVTDETEDAADDEIKCSEPCCSLGCVCSSIREKYFPPSEHCSNIDCMFGCICSGKSREAYLKVGDLSKDERSWHQKIIRKRNNALEIKSGVDRSKRRKKMPSRYDNDLVEFEPFTRPRSRIVRPISKENTPSTSGIIDLDSSASSKRNKKKKDHFSIGLSERSATAKDAGNNLLHLVWCNIHGKYRCCCMNIIIFGKNNNITYDPDTSGACTGSTISRENTIQTEQVVFYTPSDHSARTYGLIINYTKRNRSMVFKNKLSHLLKEKIISFSNSYMKATTVGRSISNNPSDNNPLVRESKREITQGVGSIVKILPEALEDSLVIDVGGGIVSELPKQLHPAPDDLILELSDDEMVNLDNTGFLLDDDCEIIAKPVASENVNSNPILQFSSLTVKERSSSKPVETPKSVEPDSDSDLELIEDPIETYSLSSSSEPETVDCGTDSEDNPSNANISGISTRCVTTKNTTASSSASCNLIIGLPVIAMNPETSNSRELPNSSILAERLQKSKNALLSSNNSENSSSKCLNGNTSSDETDKTLPASETEEINYPNHGLLCMDHPEFGYLRVDDCTLDHFIMQDPCSLETTMKFRNSKEASDYIEQLISKCVRPLQGKAKWVLGTRGVLQKFQLKPFDSSKVGILRGKKSKTTSESDASESSQTKKKKMIENDVNISDPIDLTLEEDVAGLTAEVVPVPSKLNPPATTIVPPAVSRSPNVLGTFSNLNEANTFISNNLKNRLILYPRIAGTTPNVRTFRPPGHVVQLAPRSPLLCGPRTRGGVPQPKTVRTVLVQGRHGGPTKLLPMLRIHPGSARASGPVLQRPIVATNMKSNIVETTVGTLPTTSVPMTLNTLGQIPPTTNSGSMIVATTVNQNNTIVTSSSNLVNSPSPARPGLLIPSASIATPIKNHKTTLVAAAGKPFGNNADSAEGAEPSGSGPSQPTSSDTTKSSGTFIIESFSASSPSVSSPSTIIVRNGRPVLPKPVIPKVPPRRADVIIPRNDNFATLISPAPSEIPAKVQSSSENKVYEGVVLPKPNKKKGFIYTKSTVATSSFKSILQKR